MFDLDLKTERRHAPDPDLVPILDGLTVIIFFLLLSISFIGMTKLTLPPSAVSSASSSTEIPLAGRVIAKIQGNAIEVKLEWIGSQPGSFIEKSERVVDSLGRNIMLMDVSEKLAQQYKAKFPNEKTIQIALAPQMNYQELISIMDGLRKNEMYEDLVLSSYADVDGE